MRRSPQFHLGPEIEETLKAAEHLLGESEVTAFLREPYLPDATYGSAFARLFTKLFDEWGVILLDAYDAELNAMAAPIYQERSDVPPNWKQPYCHAIVNLKLRDTISKLKSHRHPPYCLD